MNHKVRLQHSLDVPEIYYSYKTSDEGLSEDEVILRREEYGLNSLPLAPPKPAWKRFLAQFRNVLIYVLIASALISALLQHYVDAGVITAVVLVNAIVGFVQEGKAESALQAIMSMTKTQCMVIRKGVLKTIDSIELVPGDVVVLQAGDRVPADIRLFFSKDLHCDESALTGEAQPASKQLQILPENTQLADRTNMAYMGTIVTYGFARGVVCQTAIETEIGVISKLVNRVEVSQTPLQLQLTRFAHQLTIGIVVFATITMLYGILFQGFHANEMFQAAIGIAVSAIPEGLPAIVTIALAFGVQRMAASRALVRRLTSVEVLGSVDVICSDKTGTLTANAMTVREVFSASNRYKVMGEGYSPLGAVERLGSREMVLIDHDPSFTRLCEIAMLCNEANLVKDDEEWVLHGDPTEGALIALAMKHGLNSQSLHSEWPRIDVLPFESEKRYMATLHNHVDGQICLMVKGAPERVLQFAKYELIGEEIVPVDDNKWHSAIEDFATRGMRVMALAYKNFAQKPDVLNHLDCEHDLIIVGLTAISDPPRPEAIRSIQQCHEAGIRVKMITGDNPVTALAIGKELGLNASRVMIGQEIDALTDQELAKEVELIDIFARTSPANKLQIVTALQSNHHVVAMTGDGVNDTPALKKASIGVAMGLKGTDAAKDAADFVLTDDNFSTIERAVAEGRTVYDNIVKSIIFILPTNLAEALVIVTAIVFGKLMPITPAQILWVNMVTAITLALALAFERSEPNIMSRPPRPYGQGLFTKSLLLRMLLVGILGAVIVFSLFYFYRMNGASLEFSRTVAVNALVMIEVFYLFNCRFLTNSIFHRQFLVGSLPVFSAAIGVLLIQMVFTYYSGSQALFGLQSIGWYDWMIIIVCSSPVLLLVEFEKFIQRKLQKRHILAKDH